MTESYKSYHLEDPLASQYHLQEGCYTHICPSRSVDRVVGVSPATSKAKVNEWYHWDCDVDILDFGKWFGDHGALEHERIKREDSHE